MMRRILTMKYISDDGKVFETEQECCEYEQYRENQKVKRERLEKERQDRLDSINKKYKELQHLLSEYEKDYGVRQRPYVAPFYEILDMLCV
jgi:hypothetical protein